jgi:hypothetical protein
MSIQDLRDVVSTVGGTCAESEGKYDVKVASDKVEKILYDMIVKICSIQHVDNKLSLAVDCGRFR